MKSRVLFLTPLLFLALHAFGETQLKLKIFAIQSRPASEIVPIVQTVLSPKGKVVADDRTNKIFVYDQPDRFAAVEDLLKEVDIPLKNIRIKTEMVDEEELKRSGAGIRWVETGGGWRVGAFLENRTVKWNVKASQNLLVLDGEEGEIRLGSSVPLRGFFLQYLYGQGYLLPTVQLVQASTGFKVKPRLRGAEIRLEIIPFLQYPDPSGTRFIRFGEAVTTLRIPNEGSAILADSDVSGESVSRFILGSITGKERSRLLMVVSARVEN